MTRNQGLGTLGTLGTFMPDVLVSDGGGTSAHSAHPYRGSVPDVPSCGAAPVVGFDPGLSGAGAVVLPSGDLVAVFDLPVMGEGKAARIDASLLARLIAEFSPAGAVVEQVGAMPKQGVASTFAFGRAVGVLAGVLGALFVPTAYVPPGTWKRFYRLSASKEDARRRAIELWPAQSHLFARKRDHGRAEAALIAKWFVDCH